MSGPLSETLEEALARLRSDRPVIGDALKNLISIIAATQAASGSAGGKAATSGADMSLIIGCAKVVLRAINNFELVPPPQWALDHPQKDDESGSVRIQALTEYNACYLSWKQCTSAGAKPAQLLGRSYLVTTECWTDLRELCVAELAAQRFPPALAETFIDRFSRSLSNDVCDDCEADREAALVWSTDLNGVLQERQRTRQLEVAERRERLEQGEDEALRLREALASAQESADGDAVRVAGTEDRVVDVTPS